MKIKSVVMLLIGILIGIAIQGVLPSALAKGDARVTISGGDLPEEIDISEDACVMNALSAGSLDDYSMYVRTAPQVEGDGYLVTRYDLLNTGEYQPFDRLHFYFDPRGGVGYVQYEAVEDTDSPLNGRWYRPTRQSQFVMTYLLNRARAHLPLPN